MPGRGEKEVNDEVKKNISSGSVYYSIRYVGKYKARDNFRYTSYVTFVFQQTPAIKSTFASAPSLITPKVFPNAPLSMVRHPRQGELAVSLSGSPLMVTSTLCERNANVNVRLADGRVCIFWYHSKTHLKENIE
jgi:hypothetical protein